MHRDKKYGKFKLDQDTFDSDPNIIKRIMGKCIILRAESLFCEASIEYYAISDCFDVVKESEAIPIYVWEVSVDKDKDILVIKARKVKDEVEAICLKSVRREANQEYIIL